MLSCAVPFSANAADGDKVYGTMNIPYADFYAAEIDNAYAVDAVSSATARTKWAMNEHWRKACCRNLQRRKRYYSRCDISLLR